MERLIYTQANPVIQLICSLSRLASRRRNAVYLAARISPRRGNHGNGVDEDIPSSSASRPVPPPISSTSRRKAGRISNKNKLLPQVPHLRLPAFPPDINSLDHVSASVPVYFPSSFNLILHYCQLYRIWFFKVCPLRLVFLYSHWMESLCNWVNYDIKSPWAQALTDAAAECDRLGRRDE